MYEDLCYKTPFLKEVILRLDFATRAFEFEKALPDKVANVARKRFPIPEPQRSHSQEFQFSGADFSAKSSEQMQWVYHGKEREKSIIITPDSLIQTTKRYVNYENYLEDFRAIAHEVLNVRKELTVGRVGLRYVNIVDIDNGDPLSWDEYINEEMLGIVDLHGVSGVLSRAFHIVEFNYEGQMVKFQFGLANPDYPASIKQRQFVLDIDSSFLGAFDEEEVFDNIERSHEKIQELFEQSITDNTRNLMKKVMVDEKA